MTEPVDDYLWDKSGAPDPEVAHLEALLAQFRSRAPEFSWSGASAAVPMGPAGWKRLWRPVAFALAALALIAVTLTIRARFAWRPGEAWKVRTLAGSPQIAGARIGDRAGLSVGQVLVTDGTARARVRVASLGTVDVEPNSRVRLVATDTKRHRVALDYGTIEARMWAPPFSLAVDTPSAALFDLGCAFTLHVEPNGEGVVHVSSGWVEFETASTSVTIPAGAEAVTRPELGPGTPYFSDALAELKAAVAQFDSHPEEGPARKAALESILAAARPRDAFTLLTLLNQLPRAERAPVVDRLAAFVPIPAGYTRDEVLDLQLDAMNAYWSALHLGSPKSWIMHWKDVLTY